MGTREVDGMTRARRRTHDYLLAAGPCTGDELNAALKGREGNPAYHRRARELVEAGWAVEEKDKRACRITGRAVYAYRALKRRIVPPAKSEIAMPDLKTHRQALGELVLLIAWSRSQGYVIADELEHALPYFLHRLTVR